MPIVFSGFHFFRRFSFFEERLFFFRQVFPPFVLSLRPLLFRRLFPSPFLSSSVFDVPPSFLRCSRFWTHRFFFSLWKMSATAEIFVLIFWSGPPPQWRQSWEKPWCHLFGFVFSWLTSLPRFLVSSWDPGFLPVMFPTVVAGLLFFFPSVLFFLTPALSYTFCFWIKWAISFSQCFALVRAP